MTHHITKKLYKEMFIIFRGIFQNVLKPRFSNFFNDQPPPRPNTNSITPVRWTPKHKHQSAASRLSKAKNEKSIGKDDINSLGALH